MALKNVSRANEVTFSNAVRTMFKNMKDGSIVYLAFSRMNFYILIFVMGMSVIGNIVLVSLLVGAPTVVEKADTPTFIAQFTLSLSAIIAGLWLFLKGITIVTDR